MARSRSHRFGPLGGGRCDAVDHGYRLVLATDALCSSSDETHDAPMTLYKTPFAQQSDTVESEEILTAWQ